MSKEFIPFPTVHVQKREAQIAAKQNKPYESPHHPNHKKRVAAQSIMGETAATSDTEPLVVKVQPEHLRVTVQPEPSAAPVAHMGAPFIEAQIEKDLQARGMIPIQNPGYDNPVGDDEAISLALPSRFAFYGFKDLYVKPFKGRQLAKLSRAKEEESSLHMVEAVSMALSNTSGDTALGFKLTVPDFYFVLYWLRLNSFTKSAFTLESVCTNPQHIEKISKGELGPDTLKQAEIITRSGLETTMLDQVPDTTDYKLNYPGLRLRMPTMGDVVEVTEHPSFPDQEFVTFTRYTVFIESVSGPALTLDQKLAIVADMGAEDWATITSYEKAIPEYGIVEKVVTICKACGHKQVRRIEIEASHFFP